MGFWSYLCVMFLCSSLVLSMTLPPQSNTTDSKAVVAHFIMGNSYPYKRNDWVKDFTLASSKGIDAFALNVGRDSWQLSRVADAFAAARTCSSKGIDFKLFFSFDMASLPCSRPRDATTLQNYINTYHSHPEYFLYTGIPLVSTFAGEACYFGAASVNDGWATAIKNGMPSTHFVPSFFMDPAKFSSFPVMNGAFNWNSGWPMGNNDIDFESDSSYLSNLDGRLYMAAVSPWFFTHYGTDSYNKNFIFRGDDWLFSQRWESLIQNRTSIDIAQVITWNDYGESHYVGPIEGAQPNSQAWTNGFDHQGWLDLMQYYITAFKTGSYPSISRDRVFLWARLYPARADAPDRVGKPDRWQFTQDYLWAVVLLSAPAQVTLACGSSAKTTSLPAGSSKLRLPLTRKCDVETSISREGDDVLYFAPSGFTFRTNPSSYNFNAFVAASP